MTLVVNAGSGAIPPSGEGWTNTYAEAERRARRWHGTLVEDGFRDITLELPGEDLGDGSWRFLFRHGVTGVAVRLDMHGIDELKAYGRDRVFPPRVYWNDSSCGEPNVEDFAADGFEVVKTLRPVDVPATERATP